MSKQLVLGSAAEYNILQHKNSCLDVISDVSVCVFLIFKFLK